MGDEFYPEDEEKEVDQTMNPPKKKETSIKTQAEGLQPEPAASTSTIKANPTTNIKIKAPRKTAERIL